MQEICSVNPPVVCGICDPDKSEAQHCHNLKRGSKLNYVPQHRSATPVTRQQILALQIYLTY